MGKYEKTNHREICGHAHKGAKLIKPPEHYCEDCTKRCLNRCTFFQRPVVKDWNRCFYHSYYSPVAASFRCPDNLEEIMKAEEEKIA